MTSVIVIFPVLLLSLLTGHPEAVANLQIIEAGKSGGPNAWGRGPLLSGTSTLCPSRLFNKRFSALCTYTGSGPSPTWAKFYVNGKLKRRESIVPYVLSGDLMNGRAILWKDYPNVAKIRCELSNKDEAEATVRFSCTTGTKSPVQSPMATPVPRESAKPNPPIAEAPRPAAKTPKSCVNINAGSVKSLSGGWERRNGGVSFKWGNPSKGIDAGGRYPLDYSFLAPETSRYALTLDMQTSHGVDYNDVWLEFPAGGFLLLRGSSSRPSLGWTKAYHNARSRRVLAFSVDFKPHTFSTRYVLKKGRKYTVRVSGRSTRVLLFGIIMWPCTKPNCGMGEYFNNGVRKCAK